MPIIEIHLLEGRTAEQKRALVARVTDAVCETVDVKPDQVRIIIDEMKVEHYATAGVLWADRK